ncbi:MAG: DUF6364 family protein [Chloroflexi bacterium]|nr:DUF6364 family protein [Chloroflexota bacterium]
MKKRLTVNVDAELIASAKRHARDHGVTLSSLVEESLRELASTDSTLVDGEVSRRAPPRGSAPRRPERVGDTEDDSRDGREIPDFKLPPGDPPREGATSWVERWAGLLEDKPGPPPGEDDRYDYLMKKYGFDSDR